MARHATSYGLVAKPFGDADMCIPAITCWSSVHQNVIGEEARKWWRESFCLPAMPLDAHSWSLFGRTEKIFHWNLGPELGQITESNKSGRGARKHLLPLLDNTRRRPAGIPIRVHRQVGELIFARRVWSEPTWRVGPSRSLKCEGAQPQAFFAVSVTTSLSESYTTSFSMCHQVIAC